MNIDAILDRAVQDGTIPGAILLATDIKGGGHCHISLYYNAN